MAPFLVCTIVEDPSATLSDFITALASPSIHKDEGAM